MVRIISLSNYAIKNVFTEKHFQNVVGILYVSHFDLAEKIEGY